MSTRYSNASARYTGTEVLARGEEFGLDEITGDYALVVGADDELLAVEGTYGELRALLVGLLESLDATRRAQTPERCTGGGEHDWHLVEEGYGRSWPSISIDADGNVSADAHSDSFDDDGEFGYHLECQTCGREGAVKGGVDFVL